MWTYSVWHDYVNALTASSNVLGQKRNLAQPHEPCKLGKLLTHMCPRHQAV